jgi:hypothetical protein
VKHIKLLFIISLALSLITGCSTTSRARAAKGTGVKYIYDASIDTVNKVLPKTITSLSPCPPRILENNIQEGYIFAQGETRLRKVSIGISGTLVVESDGQNFLIFVDRVNDGHTEVEIVPERIFTTKVLAANWPNRIHQKLSNSFNRIK